MSARRAAMQEHAELEIILPPDMRNRSKREPIKRGYTIERESFA